VLCVHIVAERTRRARAAATAADARTEDGAQVVLGAEMNVTWTTLLRSVRIAESVKKKMMACSLVFAPDADYTTHRVVESVQFNEVVATRFTEGGS